MRLTGVIDYSMGNFLCIRGFCPMIKLANISETIPEIQRDLLSEHAGEMDRFLSGGEFTFFPEVILCSDLAAMVQIMMPSLFTYLLVFNGASETGKFCRALFHNINTKQIPLKDEENLSIIIESVNVFSDDDLAINFGTPCFLVCIRSKSKWLF